MAPAPFGPWVSLLLVSLLAPASFAQQTTTPTISDPQAVTLAAKALAALTGGKPITDVTLTGTATRTAGSDIETGTITLQALGVADSRVDFDGSAGNRSQIRNSSSGVPQGSWVGTDGVTHAMASHNCMTDAVWFFPAFSILSQASQPNVVVTYLGQETRNGATVVHLRFSRVFPSGSGTAGTLALLTHLSTVDVYLDAATLLPAEQDFSIHPDNNAALDIPVEIEYGGYEKLGGVMLPAHVKKLINGSLFLDLSLTNADINTNLSPANFELTTGQ